MRRLRKARCADQTTVSRKQATSADDTARVVVVESRQRRLTCGEATLCDVEVRVLSTAMKSSVVALLPLLAFASGRAQEHDDPNAVVGCCENGLNCQEVPASVGCRIAAVVIPELDDMASAREAQVARIELESTMSLDWFAAGDGRGPYETQRGWFAEALLDPAQQVFVGEVVDAVAEEGEFYPGQKSIYTWCTVKVNYPFTASFAPGSHVTLLYRGGVLGNHEVLTSHYPVCLPLDYGVFAISGSEFLVPNVKATASMSASDLAWDQHPYTQALADLQDSP